MDENTIIKLLDEYKAMSDRLAVVMSEKQKLIEGAIPQEVKDKISDIEQEYSPTIGTANDRLAELRSMIETAVRELKHSVKSDTMIAMYTKPRETWDGKKLDGFAAAHPEILQMKKVGKDSVTIKAR